MDNSLNRITYRETNDAVSHSHGGNILLDFLHWYFIVAPKNILSITINFLIANLNFFSIRLHLRTLFAYWHRDFEVYDGGVDIGRYFSMIVINIMSRFVGFLIRSFTIILGLLVEIFIVIVGAAWLLFWLSIPFLWFFVFYHEPRFSFSFSFLHSLPKLPNIAAFFHHGTL